MYDVTRQVYVKGPFEVQDKLIGFNVTAWKVHQNGVRFQAATNLYIQKPKRPYI